MTHLNNKVFAFCPRCGENALQADTAKSFKCSACNFVFFINCAATSIALILTPDQKLLVTTRRFEPAKGMLDFPGGFAEPGETIEQCLVREVKEELNLDIVSMHYDSSLSNTYHYKSVSYPVLDMVFFCHASNLDVLTARDDVLDVKYIAPADLPVENFGFKSTRQLAGRLRAMDIREMAIGLKEADIEDFCRS